MEDFKRDLNEIIDDEQDPSEELIIKIKKQFDWFSSRVAERNVSLDELRVFLRGLLLMSISPKTQLRFLVHPYYPVFNDALSLHVNVANWPDILKKDGLQSINDELIKQLEKFGNDDWIEPWLILLKAVQCSSHIQPNAINSLLRVAEKSFKIARRDADYCVNVAFKAWRRLIDVFPSFKKLSPEKVLYILVTPLKVDFPKSVDSVKLEIWFTLLSKIMSMPELSASEALFNKFLEFLNKNKRIIDVDSFSESIVVNLFLVLENSAVVELSHESLTACFDMCLKHVGPHKKVYDSWSHLIEKFFLDGFTSKQLDIVIDILCKGTNGLSTIVRVHLLEIMFHQKFFSVNSTCIVSILPNISRMFTPLMNSNDFRVKIFLPIIDNLKACLEPAEDSSFSGSKIIDLWKIMNQLFTDYLVKCDKNLSFFDHNIINGLLLLPLGLPEKLRTDKLLVMMEDLMNVIKYDNDLLKNFMRNLEEGIKESKFDITMTLKLVLVLNRIHQACDTSCLLGAISKYIVGCKAEAIVDYLVLLEAAVANPQPGFAKGLYRPSLTLLLKMAATYPHPYDVRIKETAGKLLRRLSSLDALNENQSDHDDIKHTSPRANSITQSNFMHRLSRAEEKNKKISSMASLFHSSVHSDELKKSPSNKENKVVTADVKLPSADSDDIKPIKTSGFFSESSDSSSLDMANVKLSNNIKIRTQLHCTTDVPSKKEIIPPLVKLKISPYKSPSEIKVSPNRKSFKNIDDLGSEEFVFIAPTQKMQPSPLTEHQKEKLRTRASDIPALYQELSQDVASQDLSSQDSFLCSENINNNKLDNLLLNDDNAVGDGSINIVNNYQSTFSSLKSGFVGNKTSISNGLKKDSSSGFVENSFKESTSEINKKESNCDSASNQEDSDVQSMKSIYTNTEKNHTDTETQNFEGMLTPKRKKRPINKSINDCPKSNNLKLPKDSQSIDKSSVKKESICSTELDSSIKRRTPKKLCKSVDEEILKISSEKQNLIPAKNDRTVLIDQEQNLEHNSVTPEKGDHKVNKQIKSPMVTPKRGAKKTDDCHKDQNNKTAGSICSSLQKNSSPSGKIRRSSRKSTSQFKRFDCDVPCGLSSESEVSNDGYSTGTINSKSADLLENTRDCKVSNYIETSALENLTNDDQAKGEHAMNDCAFEKPDNPNLPVLTDSKTKSKNEVDSIIAKNNFLKGKDSNDMPLNVPSSEINKCETDEINDLRPLNVEGVPSPISQNSDSKIVNAATLGNTSYMNKIDEIVTENINDECATNISETVEIHKVQTPRIRKSQSPVRVSPKILRGRRISLSVSPKRKRNKRKSRTPGPVKGSDFEDDLILKKMKKDEETNEIGCEITGETISGEDAMEIEVKFVQKETDVSMTSSVSYVPLEVNEPIESESVCIKESKKFISQSIEDSIHTDDTKTLEDGFKRKESIPDEFEESLIIENENFEIEDKEGGDMPNGELLKEETVVQGAGETSCHLMETPTNSTIKKRSRKLKLSKDDSSSPSSVKVRRTSRFNLDHWLIKHNSPNQTNSSSINAGSKNIQDDDSQDSEIRKDEEEIVPIDLNAPFPPSPPKNHEESTIEFNDDFMPLPSDVTSKPDNEPNDDLVESSQETPAPDLPVSPKRVKDSENYLDSALTVGKVSEPLEVASEDTVFIKLPSPSGISRSSVNKVKRPTQYFHNSSPKKQAYVARKKAKIMFSDNPDNPLYSPKNWPTGEVEPWVAFVPTPPQASPGSTILKRQSSYISAKDISPNTTPSKKRVCFQDPVVTCGLMYSKDKSIGHIQHPASGLIDDSKTANKNSSFNVLESDSEGSCDDKINTETKDLDIKEISCEDQDKSINDELATEYISDRYIVDEVESVEEQVQIPDGDRMLKIIEISDEEVEMAKPRIIVIEKDLQVSEIETSEVKPTVQTLVEIENDEEVETIEKLTFEKDNTGVETLEEVSDVPMCENDICEEKLEKTITASSRKVDPVHKSLGKFNVSKETGQVTDNMLVDGDEEITSEVSLKTEITSPKESTDEVNDISHADQPKHKQSEIDVLNSSSEVSHNEITLGKFIEDERNISSGNLCDITWHNKVDELSLNGNSEDVLTDLQVKSVDVEDTQNDKACSNTSDSSEVSTNSLTTNVLKDFFNQLTSVNFDHSQIADSSLMDAFEALFEIIRSRRPKKIF